VVCLSNHDISSKTSSQIDISFDCSSETLISNFKLSLFETDNIGIQPQTTCQTSQLFEVISQLIGDLITHASIITQALSFCHLASFIFVSISLS